MEKPKNPSETVVEAGKLVVQVQQHFNDIELRIRNYALTILAAVLGVAAYAFREHVPYGIILGIFCAALILCYAFYFMDRHWYHRLLIGAVKHARSIEEAGPPELKLTIAIGNESPVKILGFELHSDDKISIFYGLIALAILIMALFTLIFASPTSNASSTAATSTPESARTQTVTPSASITAITPMATPSVKPTPSRTTNPIRRSRAHLKSVGAD